MKREFIYPLDDKPTPQCHASTIALSQDGLIAAWFGGTREDHPDVGIWISRRRGGNWSAPRQVADGVALPSAPEGASEPDRFPCWNPVLFQPDQGPLLLFYKVGPNPRAWWGMWMTSDDGGERWSQPARLPDGILGPIKNKPIQLLDGTILCPSSSEDNGWRVHLEITRDGGATWQRLGPIHDGHDFKAIQPTLLTCPDGRIEALCRSRQGVIVESWSQDGGLTWSAMAATGLPNPNSGIDGVTLSDGRQLLVYNHTTRGRSPLNVALSDDGKRWHRAWTLEDAPGEYSYPAVIQTPDGVVHITYTYQRLSIRHVVIDAER